MPTAEIYEKKKCAKCGRMKPNVRFYKDRKGVRVDTCRECLLEGVDLKKPSTFLPVLQKLDYPFIEELWLEQCKKQYTKDPERFDPKNVVGIYSRVMKLGFFRDFGWAENEAANEAYKNRMSAIDEAEVTKQRRKEAAKAARDAEKARQEAAKKAKEEEKRAAAEAKKQAEKEWLEAEEAKIREARQARQREIMERQAAELADQEVLEAIRRGETFDKNGVLHDGLVGRPPVDRTKALLDVPTPKKRGRPRKEDAEKKKTEDSAKAQEDKAAAPKKKRGRPPKPKPTLEQEIVGTRTAEESLGLLSDKQLVAERAIMKKLTDDDVRQMTVKWGDTYRPSEWLRMEEMYQKYASEFELSIDREETLRQICKVSLKLDQSIDSGEYADSAKLSSMLDTLRKSAKFTEAQNKEEKGSYISSIGQLVGEVERIGGIIPSGEIGKDYPQDKVDITLQDNQRYLYNLVKGEGGLGNLIESYIQKLDQAKAAEAKNKATDEDDDEDYAEYIEAMVEKEAEELFASFDEEV